MTRRILWAQRPLGWRGVLSWCGITHFMAGHVLERCTRCALRDFWAAKAACGRPDPRGPGDTGPRVTDTSP